MARLLVASRSMALALRLADAHRISEYPVENIHNLQPNSDVDVIVLDVGEPSVAIQTVDRLRESGHTTPILVVSGYQPEWTGLLSLNLPGVRVVPLPITRAALLKGIGELFAEQVEPLPEGESAPAVPHQAAVPADTHADFDSFLPGGPDPQHGAELDLELEPEPEFELEPEPEIEPELEPEPSVAAADATAQAPPKAVPPAQTPAGPARRSLLGRRGAPLLPAPLSRRAGTHHDTRAKPPQHEPAQSGGGGSRPARDLNLPDGPSSWLPAARSASAAEEPPSAEQLVGMLLERVSELFGVADTAQVLADETVERSDADAAAVLVPDDHLWRVAAGVGLRPLERRLVMDSSNWLISEIAVGGKALIIEDTDIVRPKLAGTPLAAWKHLLAVPIPSIRAAVVLARGGDAGPFTDRELNVVVGPVREAAGLLGIALATRRLARLLGPLRDIDPTSARPR